MNYKAALDQFDKYCKAGFPKNEAPSSLASALAIEALEKQVPKEPIQKEDSALGYAWYCPGCGGWIDPSTYKHCPDCGQLIKKG